MSRQLPLGDRVLKVDHAGEHGAVCVYRAQLFIARWRAPSMTEELSAFLGHELRHRALFAGELIRRGRPRCRSYWLCGIGGFLLGSITGMLGRGAIAATTVAIEQVVLRHLSHQMAELTDDPHAVAIIGDIVREEQSHLDDSLKHLAGRNNWERLLTPVVSNATEVVIWLGMKL